jgi:hypothetical protein
VRRYSYSPGSCPLWRGVDRYRSLSFLLDEGELFAQMFSVSEEQTVNELDSAAHLSPQRLIEKYGTLQTSFGPEPVPSACAFLTESAGKLGIVSPKT